ncbi:hypothetical protein AJ80_02978 [Polytolypa hystricis UAMH7299]|uniref:Uncharacterized protein n=1 Tax=Polytolypa hystricis (strain UAMH7299) TaxID=1447883 RepID=A0A2B7YPF6_POLH7|nr:hypothetical protein AJ80_02978 [Polytolypa hystricis UAMH7299]
MSGTSNNNNSGGGKRSWWGARFFGSNPREYLLLLISDSFMALAVSPPLRCGQASAYLSHSVHSAQINTKSRPHSSIAHTIKRVGRSNKLLLLQTCHFLHLLPFTRLSETPPEPDPQKLNPQIIQSINVPLAAFCMAVVLTTYCVTSIRSARRNVRYETIKAPHTTTTAAAAAAAGAVDEGGKVDEDSSSSWLIQQLEARREEGRVREGRARGLREGKAGR